MIVSELIYSYKGKEPRLATGVFVAPGAALIGDVTVGKESSIWYGCTVRGDVNYVKIGERCNIQDHSMIHVTGGKYPTILGDDVTLGHRVTLHGCVLHNQAFVGIGATVMDGCEIGHMGLLAAGSLLPPGKKVPAGMMAMGVPARVVREITPEEREMILRIPEIYLRLAGEYLNGKDVVRVSPLH